MFEFEILLELAAKPPIPLYSRTEGLIFWAQVLEYSGVGGSLLKLSIFIARVLKGTFGKLYSNALKFGNAC